MSSDQGTARGVRSLPAYAYLLITGNAVSAYGTYLNMVALNLAAYQITGSALFTGLFLTAKLLCGLIASPAAARLIARFGHRAVMVTSDLSQAAVLGVLILTPAAAHQTVLYAVAVVAGAGGTFSQVAIRSCVPLLVAEEHRKRANGLLIGGRSAAMIIGFASAGIVVSLAGYAAAFAIDAITFVVSATANSRLPLPRRAPAVVSEPAPRRRGLLPNWAVAVATGTASAIVLRGADGFGSSSHQVGMPIYSTLVDPAAPAVFAGQFWAVWAVGCIVAQWWLSRAARPFSGTAPIAVGSIVMSSAFILVFAHFPLIPTLLFALVAGIADGFTEFTYLSRLQEAPDAGREEVFGVAVAAETLGLGGGMLVCSVILQWLSPFQAALLLHGTAIVVSLTVLLLLRRRPVRPT
ncbi:MFS transporter [Kutzneria sp. NPDC052558]|uniref:MFS transporter n=1 Tax=Kutzneria sp. NPDC052558 TaxID=3364121 RepID=UPI0037C9BB8A